jgi:hypothetical protein
VQCDDCHKWRRLPRGVLAKELPEKWHCAMGAAWASALNPHPSCLGESVVIVVPQSGMLSVDPDPPPPLWGPRRLFPVGALTPLGPGVPVQPDEEEQEEEEEEELEVMTDEAYAMALAAEGGGFGVPPVKEKVRR